MTFDGKIVDQVLLNGTLIDTLAVIRDNLQASLLNVASVARDCGVAAKVAHDYFQILEDLLVAVRIPVFSRRAKLAEVCELTGCWLESDAARTPTMALRASV